MKKRKLDKNSQDKKVKRDKKSNKKIQIHKVKYHTIQ